MASWLMVLIPSLGGNRVPTEAYVLVDGSVFYLSKALIN